MPSRPGFEFKTPHTVGGVSRVLGGVFRRPYRPLVAFCPMVRPLVRILHHIHFGFFLAGNKTQHNFLTFTVGCGVIERKIVFCIDCCMFYLVSPTPLRYQAPFHHSIISQPTAAGPRSPVRREPLRIWHSRSNCLRAFSSSKPRLMLLRNFLPRM